MKSARRVLRLGSDASAAGVGVRAGALLEAARQGMPLPALWVVPGQVYAGATALLLPEGHAPSALLRSSRARPSERVARARQHLLAKGRELAREILAELPPAVQHAEGLAFVASPVCRDLDTALAAGLLKTYFSGKLAHAVPLSRSPEDALLEVWALSCDDTALELLLERRARELEMAVLILPVSEHHTTFRRTFGPPEMEWASSRLEEPNELRCRTPRRAEAPTEPASVIAQGATVGGFEAAGKAAVVDFHVSPAWQRRTDKHYRTPVWSQRGLGDLQGALTPLTWSLLRGLDSDLLSQLMPGRLELPKGRKLLGSFGGVCAVDYSLIVEVLGLPLSRAALSAMGLEALTDTLRLPSEPPSTTELGAAASRAVGYLAWLEGALEELQAAGEQGFAAFRELDVGILPQDALVTTLHDTRRAALQAWRLWLIARLTLMLQAGVFTSWLGRNMDRGVARSMLAAVLPPERPTVRSLACLERATLPLDSWVELYGHLPVQSLDLGAPRWDEELSGAGSQGPASSRRGRPEPATDGSHPRLVAARLAADRELASLERDLKRHERWMLSQLSRTLRRLTAISEAADDWVCRGLWMYRRTVLDVDRRLGRLEHDLGPNSAFHCTHRELSIALRSSSRNLQPLSAMRRARAERDARETFDPRTAEAGQTYAFPEEASDDAKLLRGVGNGRGQCSGRPFQVTDIAARLPAGCIGVAARFYPWLGELWCAAAGWVVLEAPAFSSPWLSACQLGVPVVAGTALGAAALSEASELHLDSTEGVVRLS